MNYELICLVCENENAHLRSMAFAAKVKIVAISAANGLYIITLLLLDWNFLTFNFFFYDYHLVKICQFLRLTAKFFGHFTIYSFETLLQ